MALLRSLLTVSHRRGKSHRLHSLSLLTALAALVAPAARGQSSAPVRYPIQGQPHWEWLLPTPTGHTLWDAHLFTDSSLIAVGSHGTAVRTRDNGRHWRVLPLPAAFNHDLTSVAFADTLNGWIAGHTEATLPTHFRAGPGGVLRTTNGGRTWTAQAIGETRSTVNPRLAVVSATEAYVAYDYLPLTPPRYLIPPPQTRLRHTTNGGTTWTNVAWPDLPFVSNGVPLRAVRFFSSSTGVLIGGDELAFSSYCLRTTDGGLTWQDIKPDPSLKAYNGYFADAQHGWVVGKAPSGFATCYRTTDGGLTWQPLATLPTTGNAGFADVVFADPLHGLLREANLQYYHITADGGQTWTINYNLDLTINYTSRLKLGPGATGRGWWLSGQGALLRTADYGATWAPAYTTPVPLRTLGEVAFPEPTRGWAFSSGRGSNSTLRSTDRGATWQRQYLPNLSTAVNWNQVGNLTAAAFPDRDTAWVIGTEYGAFPNGTGFVLGTTDGGQSWTRAALPAPPLRANGIGTWTGQRAALAGNDGALHLTRDGGRTWTRATTGTTRPLYRPVWADSATLYVATDTALVLRSADAGRTWQQVAVPFNPGQFGRPVVFTSALVGYYPDGQDIYRTTDGGQTWDRTFLLNQASYDLNGQKSSSLQTFAFRDHRHGWALGQTDVFETADAGQTWTKLAYVGGYGSAAAGSPGTLIDRYNAFNSGTGITRYSEKYIQTDTSAAQPLSYCGGDTATVAFDTVGVFSAAERDFRVELSNKMGRFRPHETTILPLVGAAAAAPLRAVLPATLAAGTRYRLRVIRADSSVLGGDNEHDITLTPRPAAVAVAPADSVRLCAGDSVLLAAPAGYGQYQWSTGATSAALWVKTAGAYSVQVANGGGCFGPASAPVTVRQTPRPDPPVLSLSQSGTALLTASPALPGATYLWTGPAGLVAGASGPTLLLTGAAQNGAYTATLTLRGCTSAASAAVSVTVTGLTAEADPQTLTLVPNPATARVAVRAAAGLRHVALLDPVGRVISNRDGAGSAEILLPLADLPTGSYWVRATLPTGRVLTRRLLVIH